MGAKHGNAIIILRHQLGTIDSTRTAKRKYTVPMGDQVEANAKAKARRMNADYCVTMKRCCCTYIQCPIQFGWGSENDAKYKHMISQTSQQLENGWRWAEPNRAVLWDYLFFGRMEENAKRSTTHQAQEKKNVFSEMFRSVCSLSSSIMEIEWKWHGKHELLCHLIGNCLMSDCAVDKVTYCNAMISAWGVFCADVVPPDELLPLHLTWCVSGAFKWIKGNFELFCCEQ